MALTEMWVLFLCPIMFIYSLQVYNYTHMRGVTISGIPLLVIELHLIRCRSISYYFSTKYGVKYEVDSAKIETFLYPNFAEWG